MTLRKIAALLLAVCLLATAVGCKSNEESPSFVNSGEVQKSNVNKDFSILYCYSDSFDPYKTATELNRQLCLLLYDPLIRVDNEWNPTYCLAKSVDLTGTSCTVTLKDARFTDGSAVTAQDVVYSFNMAKKSSSEYSYQLYEVLSASEVDALTTVFKLSRFDPYFLNLLDFPIVKSGSCSVVNSDGVAIAPIGCGRYVLSEDCRSVTVNTGYYGKQGEIKTIMLCDAPDKDSVSHYVEVGATSIYYTDLSDGKIVRMSGKKVDVNLNNLVYIGINSSYGDLATKEMRYAISSAVDRSAICQGAYYNNADAAKGFFNPSFAPASAVQTINSSANIEITIENLEKIGYNSLDKNGYRCNVGGKHPVYTLLVNKENPSRLLAAKLIASQLKTAGIEINVIERTFEQYNELLKSGAFQLYLGETHILSNMDMSNLVCQGGSAAFGVGKPSADDTDKKTASDDKKESGTEGNTEENVAKTVETLSCQDILNRFYSGTATVNDVAGILISEMPQIPVCYRKGMLFYDKNIESGVVASQGDVFFSIENYHYTNNSGGN